MKPRNLALIITLSLLITIALILSWLYKSVTVVIDGVDNPISTFAITVQDVLRYARVRIGEGDVLNPPISHWLKDGESITLHRAFQVPILADGRLVILLTAERAPKDILKEAEIALNAGDVVTADGQFVPVDIPLIPKSDGQMPPMQLRRSLRYTLVENDQKETLESSLPTLGQALWDAGIVYSSDDQLAPSPETRLASGLEAHLQRARSITIRSGGNTYQVRTVANTVGEALARAGFPLQGLDYSVPAEDAPVPDDGNIRVVKVKEEVIVEQTTTTFKKEYQAADDLEIDRQEIVQAGVPGINARRIRVRYEDGQEISRQVEEEWIARLPQPQIIGYGTKVIPLTLDTPDGTITYWRAIQMYAVSYHPSETGGNVTASGLVVRKGLAAVDTRYIPFFTRLYIPGYGEAIAADTGGGVVGRMIDLAYSDNEYVPWHQYVTVYFLWPPPEKIVWIIP